MNREKDTAATRDEGGVVMEVGRYYVRRDGEVFGPCWFDRGHFGISGAHYTEDGLYAYHGLMPRTDFDRETGEGGFDLVSVVKAWPSALTVNTSTPGNDLEYNGLAATRDLERRVQKLEWYVSTLIEEKKVG